LKRVTLFAKGNVDVHDSLHSCRVAGERVWNGVNEIVRSRHPGATVRVRHETATRSDALLGANGVIPPDLAERALALGPYRAEQQFSARLFTSDADAIVLSILPDIATTLIMRHRRLGYLLYPHDAAAWSPDDAAWLTREFARIPPLDAAASMANHGRIIARIRETSDAPILIYNLSPVIPGERAHCFQGLEDALATRIRRFNLALIELSEATGVSIIDVETIVARAGADRVKLDSYHLTGQGYRLVAEDVVRVLDELGVFDEAR
jgi:lysophospholipase L1-like esterase